MEEKKKFVYKPKSKLVRLPKEVKVPQSSSELVVITKTKDLVKYIFQISKNSPKKFRQTFVNRLQNLALDIIENIYMANDTMILKNDKESFDKRFGYQKIANTKLKLLEYFALLAYESECILFKQFEQICKQGTNVKILLANWIASDQRRLKK